MKKPIMAICDRQPFYTNQLISLFQGKRELPFEVYGFTKEEKLLDFCRENRVALLVISEPDYRSELQKEKIDRIFLLREGEEGTVRENVISINKFQPAGTLYREIMKSYGECENAVPCRIIGIKDFQLIGIYSPVHRTLQTTMALTMGQLLSEKKKTLYLNFECFSGLEVLMGKKFGGNLTDILYFYECAPEKLPYKLESIVQDMNGLHMIPPADSYEDFKDIQEKEWLEIISRIAAAGGYDVILLDLSEQVRGLFKLLEACDKIYTLIKDDRMAKAKLAQYELLLEKHAGHEILEKTEKCLLPVFKCLPAELERLGRSELAGYAGKLLKEDGFL